MKKALLIGVVVLAALAVAGVVFGPKLHDRLFGPATPLGRVRDVKPIAAYGEPNDPNKVQPEPGNQLWLVQIDARTGARGLGARSPREDETMDELLEKVSLIDDTGNRHKPWKVTYTAEWTGQAMTVTVFELVFSLPQERKPRFLQVGDPPAVELP